MLRVEDIQRLNTLYMEYRDGSLALQRLRSSLDLVKNEPSLYISDINVVAISPGVKGIVYAKYKCGRCNYEYWSIDKGELDRCPMCRKGIASRTEESLSIVYRKAKALLLLDDAGPTYVDTLLLNLFNSNVLNIRGGRYTVVAYPVLINNEPHILIVDLVNVQVRTDRWMRIVDKVLEHKDFLSRLSTILDWFAVDRVYGMHEEKAALLAALVGAGRAYVGGRPITELLSRYWLNVAWFGPPETGKSMLADYVQRATPDSKSILLTGSKQTLPGLIMSGFGGQLMLGPFAILDGGETDFGVLILEEAERLPEEHVLELKHALEHGRHGRALGTTGYVPVYTRCSLVLIGNLLEETPPTCFPTWLRDPAILTRMDIILVSLYPESEDEEKSIIHRKLHGIFSTVKPDDWALYLKHCREHAANIDVRNIEPVLEEHRRSLATDINSLFKVSIRGFRIADSLLRIAIALAKLTLCRIVTREHVEFAARLIEVMLSRIRTLRETHLRPITKYQLVRLLFEEGLIEHVLRPNETITIDELYERLKQELLDRGYMLSRQLLEQILESEKAKIHLTFPETGKVKLAR